MPMRQPAMVPTTGTVMTHPLCKFERFSVSGGVLGMKSEFGDDVREDPG